MIPTKDLSFKKCYQHEKTPELWSLIARLKFVQIGESSLLFSFYHTKSTDDFNSLYFDKMETDLVYEKLEQAAMLAVYIPLVRYEAL